MIHESDLTHDLAVKKPGESRCGDLAKGHPFDAIEAAKEAMVRCLNSVSEDGNLEVPEMGVPPVIYLSIYIYTWKPTY